MCGPCVSIGSACHHYVNEIPKATKAKMEVGTKVEWNPIKQDVKKGKLRYFGRPGTRLIAIFNPRLRLCGPVVHPV